MTQNTVTLSSHLLIARLEFFLELFVERNNPTILEHDLAAHVDHTFRSTLETKNLVSRVRHDVNRKLPLVLAIEGNLKQLLKRGTELVNRCCPWPRCIELQ